MTKSIYDHQLANNSYNLYDVRFFEYEISTIVTSTPEIVDQWIFETQLIHSPVIVGLDVEWLPNRTKNSKNPVATLQLCVGNRCLIFQILHSPIIPYSLAFFLGNPSYIFTGVGIDDDVKKLWEDYHLVVARTEDLRSLAVAKYGVRKLINAGIKKLSCKVLRRDIGKPKVITMSAWDSQWLTPGQVQYACLDAFLSSEIARVLMKL